MNTSRFIKQLETLAACFRDSTNDEFPPENTPVENTKHAINLGVTEYIRVLGSAWSEEISRVTMQELGNTMLRYIHESLLNYVYSANAMEELEKIYDFWYEKPDESRQILRDIVSPFFPADFFMTEIISMFNNLIDNSVSRMEHLEN